MELGDLYQFVLLIVLIGLLIGVGMVVLSNFEQTTAVTGTASTAINNTVTAISAIPSTWLPLIVTIAVLSIVLVLVIRAFGQNR